MSLSQCVIIFQSLITWIIRLTFINPGFTWFVSPVHGLCFLQKFGTPRSDMIMSNSCFCTKDHSWSLIPFLKHLWGFSSHLTYFLHPEAYCFIDHTYQSNQVTKEGVIVSKSVWSCQNGWIQNIILSCLLSDICPLLWCSLMKWWGKLHLVGQARAWVQIKSD